MATGDDVWLFTGCVMDAWQRDIHRAAIAVLGACGAGVALPGPGAACCGALHVHAGLRSDAARLARRVMRAFPGSAPILVDSAGCGAALKDYGHLLGTGEAERFSARVMDIHEWLAERADRLPAARPRCAPRCASRSRTPAICATCSAAKRPSGWCWPPTARSSSSTTTAAAAAPAAPTAPSSPSWPGGSGPRSWRSSPPPPPTWWPAPTPAAGCGWPGAGVPVRHPLEIVAEAAGLANGRRPRNPPMAGEFEDIRGRLLQISEELADLAIERLRESIDAGGVELPVDERRLTRARRAVERAAAILAEPDDSDWEG